MIGNLLMIVHRIKEVVIIVEGVWIILCRTCGGYLML